MSHEQNISFSHFGKSFQEKLCKVIFEDRPFADQIGEVIDINYFESKYLQVFAKLVYSYKEKYSKHPDKDTMEAVLRTKLSEESDIIQGRVRNFFASIVSGMGQENGHEYVKDEALTFCRRQKIKEGFISSARMLKDNESFDKIKDKIDVAFKLGSVNDSGYHYMKDFERRFELVARNPIKSGWDEIDQITHGGIGRGELGVVIAPTGAGKSMALVHLGAQAMLNGLNVVHYTLELMDTVVASRYDAAITGFTLKSLYGLKEEIYEKITSLSLGNLIVKEYPTKSATTQTITHHLESLRDKEGIKVDMIIVDYGDLLRPLSAQREKRNELESIYEELRGIAQAFTCPLWTASQTNRAGLNAEVITMESISEAFSKCFVADFICTISRTIEDKNNNQGRMFIAKNRNGIDGIVYPMVIDTSKVEMRVLPNRGETIAAVVEESAREKMKNLKEKYKKHKQHETT